MCTYTNGRTGTRDIRRVVRFKNSRALNELGEIDKNDFVRTSTSSSGDFVEIVDENGYVNVKIGTLRGFVRETGCENRKKNLEEPSVRFRPVRRSVSKCVSASRIADYRNKSRNLRMPVYVRERDTRRFIWPCTGLSIVRTFRDRTGRKSFFDCTRASRSASPQPRDGFSLPRL